MLSNVEICELRVKYVHFEQVLCGSRNHVIAKNKFVILSPHPIDTVKEEQSG